MTELSLRKSIPDDHHVVRYIPPRHIDNGIVNGEAFLRRPHEEASSVNWLEYFKPPVENQVKEIRAAARLRYAKTGVLARLNVGETKEHVKNNSPLGLVLDFVHDPLPESAPYEGSPSHALIHGIPATNSPEAAIIQDLISECIIDPVYQAIPSD